MRKKLADVLGVLLRSWDTLLCFEILYKAAGHSLLFPFIRARLEGLPALIGADYLGQENVLLLLRSPAALLTLAGVLLLLAFYLLFEICALLAYCEAGWQRRRITLWGILRQGFLHTAVLFRPKRAAVLLLLPPLLLSVFSFASGWLRTVRVPEFILEYIRGAPALAVLYAALILGCNLLLFCRPFVLPAMLLRGASFKEAWRESRLLPGRKLRLFGALLPASGLLAALFVLSAAAGVLLLAGGVKAFCAPERAAALFRFYLVSLQRAASIAAGAAASVLLCAALLRLYHIRRGDPRPQAVRTGGGWKNTVKRSAFVLFTIVLLTFAGESELGGALPLSSGRAPLLVAHRAGAAFAPENTVAALLQAAADGAQQAEIDVQQLKDGTLVVMHDVNFRRTAGLDKNVWDTVYGEVRGLDNGSSFSADFAGEPVPTLAAMLRAAKGRIGLMIELKTTGRETGLEQATIDAIRAQGMEGQCSIASMDLDTLRRAKALAPDIPTVYISALLLSDRYDLQQLDGYSVETTSLSRGMVAAAHAQGKLVYGWTANSAKTLSKLLRSQVDGVLTDNVPFAEYCIRTNGENLFADETTALFFPA